MNIIMNYLGKSNSGPIIAYEMAKGLAQNGHAVSAILSSEISNKVQWINCDLLHKVVFLDTYKDKKQFLIRSIRMLLFGKSIIMKNLNGETFDVVINPMHHMWSTFICDVYANKRIITVCHDPIAHEGENKLETYLTQKLMRISNDIIVLSKQYIPVVKDKYGLDNSHVFFMKHGLLDTYRKCASSETKAVYKEDGWKFLFFGRIEEYKGIYVLLEAFSKLSKEYDNVSLYIVGKGTIEDKERYDINSKIIINNGYIPDEEVAKYFDDNRVIVVLPYISASQSGVVAIAADFGNIIIASRVGGLEEQLMDGKVGIYVEPKSVEDLSKQMSFIINDQDEQKRQRVMMSELKNQIQWSTIMNKLSGELFPYDEDDKYC
jgi:glycosyltransferase involved in cell wall biosynthesis